MSGESAAAARRRLARRASAPWRLALAVYAAALLLGTHWPRLSLGTEESPFPDKLVHLGAFGGLTVLLVLSRVLPVWAAGIVAAVWTALDELSQSIPGLGRTISWQDLAAGLLGVALAMTWVWALGPVGGLPSQTRRACRAHVRRELLRRPRTWVAAGLGAGLGGAVLSAIDAIAHLVGWLLAPDVSNNLERVMLIAPLAAAAAGCGTVAFLTERAMTGLDLHRPCFACGRLSHDARLDEFGRGRCTECGAALHRGQWTNVMFSHDTAVGRSALRAVAAMGIVALAGLTLLGVPIVLSERFRAVHAIFAWWGQPEDLRQAAFLAVNAAVWALGTRVFRSHQARLFDRQHASCRACGYDLSGAPLEYGCGGCPECGVPFVRFPQQPEAVGETRGT